MVMRLRQKRRGICPLIPKSEAAPYLIGKYRRQADGYFCENMCIGSSSDRLLLQSAAQAVLRGRAA